MFDSIFKKVKYFAKFITSMIITFLGFFLSNKDDEDGSQKTIKKKITIKQDKAVFCSEETSKQLQDLYPVYKEKTDKLLKGSFLDLNKQQKDLEKLLKEIPETEELRPLRQKIEKHLEALKVVPIVKKVAQANKLSDKSYIIQSQKGVNKVKNNFKLQSPTIMANKKKNLGEVNESKRIQSFRVYSSKPKTKIKPSRVTFSLIKTAPLVAIASPSLAKHIVKRDQHYKLQGNQSSKYIVKKEGPTTALEPKIVPKTKYVIPQIYLNEAIHISKKIASDALTKQKLTKEKNNILGKVEYLLSKKAVSKTRLLPFKLFKRKEVQDLYSASILNNNLVSSVNLLNGTNFSYHKVHFLTLLNRKKTMFSLKKITFNNLETAKILKVSLKNKYGNNIYINPRLNAILKKIENFEEQLNKKNEQFSYSKAKTKVKTIKKPFSLKVSSR